jgi:hypothetical protein
MNPKFIKYLTLSIVTALSTLSACTNSPSSQNTIKRADQPYLGKKNVLIVLSAKNSLTLEDGETIPTGCGIFAQDCYTRWDIATYG